MHHVFRRGKRVLIAVSGGIVVLIGIVLIPYPGPGWLVVFGGFALLATEFEFAEKLLERLKERYEYWKVRLQLQSPIVRVAALLCTGIVVMVTVWLCNTFGLIDTFFSLHQPWLHSPFFRK